MTIRAGTLALLVAAAPVPLAAQNAIQALARAQHAYDAAPTFVATFTQTITNPMLGGPETSHGTLYLRKPDHFALNFSDPKGDRIVADGTWLWAYTPSTTPGQVMRRPVPSSGANTPNLFGQFVDRPAERYTISYVGADSVNGTPVDVVRLIPRDSSMGFRDAVIAVGPDGLLRRITLVEDSGQHREFVFEKVTANGRVPDADVTFVVPRGVKVVTP